MRTWSNTVPILLAGVLLGSAHTRVHAQAASDMNLPDSPGVTLAAQTDAEAASASTSSAPQIAQDAQPPATSFDSATDSAPSQSSSPQSFSSDSVVSNQSPIYPTSHPYLHRVVGVGKGPQPLSAPQKFEMSFRSRLSYGAIFSSFFGAGERQLLNSRPHYGTDRGAFGERLGAAELGQVTEAFFSYGLYASVFHDDPHYYVMGPQHSIASRALYAATRVVLTRTDDGGTAPNWSKLAGVATGQAIVNAYYPPQDRGVGQTAGAIGGYLAASILTLELHEFWGDAMAAIRHQKQPTE